ncbi:MAG: peptidase [Actinomycetales bacterium]|nr:peptidase [Actinomycetales bacterium]
MSDVTIAPFMRPDYTLAGFVISGRWPESTREWAQFLALAVRIAAYPGTVQRTSVFRSLDDLPEDPAPDTVGLVTLAGPVIGDDAPRPGELSTPQPAALFVLHPPAETTPSTPECAGAASGALLLPGVPHLGLEHRATWVEAEADGTVTRLISRVGIDPAEDPDIAVLATLVAA